ncbi:hypothetical protein SLE2022_353620 [Rubroshorea leprosula]
MEGCSKSTGRIARVEVDCFGGLRMARVVTDWFSGLRLDRVWRFNLDIETADEGIGPMLNRVRLDEDEDDILPLLSVWKLDAFKVEKLWLVGINSPKSSQFHFCCAITKEDGLP